ncbi:aldehyde dehydrogenase family protein [Kiloniella laminariae]|uniref:aldehyde dehydrogenase family protein n=1 Tax=Kiloniella laminariae TaxID=454162 RepID=UPI00036D1F20|nr:aldehyde dehydrogenase family protein [Kiloniella laminariae]
MKKNYIDGQYIEGATARENINPSDISEVVGLYSQADAAQARAAIDVAHSAAEGWAKSTPQQRFDVLDAIGTELLARKAELGELLSREEGKTLPEGIGETARAGQIFKFFAGEALRLKGDKLASVRPGVDVEVVREALGVIGIITPWNFPIAIPAWKIAPALCYGNAVVFKPADLVPGCGWALADIIARSGLPKGVFNLVMGRGSVVGEEILTNRKVRGVTFTGSVATGQHVAATCAGRLAKFQLEMGGKNPLVVLDDADLDSAVETAVQGAFFSTGQRCTASSRLIITEGIHDRFVAGVIKRLEGLKVDHALSDGVHIGPVVDDSQLAQDLEYIRVGQSEGAKLAFGGQLLERATKGFYLSPALFTETSNSMRINREEIFGPVASVIRVKGYEEALAVANDTEFGLSSGICTTSLKYATDFKRNAKAGMAMVNLPTAGVDYHVPFGGTKGSSFGSREQGSYAAEFFTTVKTSYTLA